MYPLFELVRLFSIQEENSPSSSAGIVRFAHREAGENSHIALACTNGYLLLHYTCHGKSPTIKQIPWPTEKHISGLTFDPTATWLLALTRDCSLFIIPALSVMNPTAKINQLWRDNDVTSMKFKKTKGSPDVVVWWHTMDDQQIAIIGTRSGELLFVDLLSRAILKEVVLDAKIMQLDIVEDDQQMSTYLLITDQSGVQWKLLLERRTHDLLLLPDKEVAELGYDTVDGRSLPLLSIIHSNPLVNHQYLFLPLRFYQFQRSEFLSPQYARGRHFITAHCNKSNTYQVYDSNIEHNPLFVYKLPVGAYNVILTDKVIFTTTRLGAEKKLLVVSNQTSETSAEDPKPFNKDSVLQHFDLPQEERLLIVVKKCYPFYWHEKREENLRQKQCQDRELDIPVQDKLVSASAYDIHVTAHTVLNGCLIITESAVYECRPRVSPERLFLQLAIRQTDTSVTESLGFSLGLDLNTLYEAAAEYSLLQKDTQQAIRLYKLSKCSHKKKVAGFASQGHSQEVLSYVRQVLSNPGSDLTTADRKILMNLAIHCFVYQVQCTQNDYDKEGSQNMFIEFLISNFSYDESNVLNLLAEHGLIFVLFEVAKARGMVMEALQCLLTHGHTQIQPHIVQDLVHKGFLGHLIQISNGIFINSMDAKEKITLLLSSPMLLIQHYTKIENELCDLDIADLLQVAAIFDPSQPSTRSHVAKSMLSKRRTPSISSLTSLSSESEMNFSQEISLPSASKLVTFFIQILLTLNSKYFAKGNYPEKEFILITNSKQLSKSLPNELPVKTHKKVHCELHPLDAGPAHGALVINQDLYTWGSPSQGRLGHGDLVSDTHVSPPSRVETLHMLQIKVLSVSCGAEHTVALTQQGVYAWGSSKYGQVGNGTRHMYTRPMLLDEFISKQCVSLSCGMYHTLALTDEGRVYSWGWGIHGQLGHGDPDDSLQPKMIEALSDIVQISAGYSHSLARNSHGQLLAFGCGYFGQLGLTSSKKSTVPILVKGIPEKVLLMATKYFHNVVVTQSNRVYTWGCHPYNVRYTTQSMRKARLLGVPSGTGIMAADPVEAFLKPELVDTSYVHGRIVQVKCGSSHSILTTLDGDVYTWGRNLDGQIGNNTRQEMKYPSMVTSINDRQVAHVTSGGEFTLALDKENLLWGWGKNDKGQLAQQIEKLTLSQSGRHGKPKSSKIQVRGQLGSDMPDFLVPNICQGLPSAKPLKSSWRQHHLLNSGSQEGSDTEFLEDKGDYYQTTLLPDLYSMSHGQYRQYILLELLQHLSSLCNEHQLLRECVNHQDWLSAAYVCVHQKDYAQAYMFHTQALHKYRPVFTSGLCDPAMELLQYYVKLIVEENMSAAQREESLRCVILQSFKFWRDHSLPLEEFESSWLMYKEEVACILSVTILGIENNEQTSSNPDDPDKMAASSLMFSNKFQLEILTTLFMKLSASDFEKKHPISSSFLKSVLKDQFEDCDLDLQTSDRLTPMDQVWQDVINNLQKNETRNYIYLTRSELDHMTIEDHDANFSMVAFTCGHHYQSKTFVNEVLLKMNQELTSSLPHSGSLLSQYYNQRGLVPLSCPKCVLNAL